MQNGSGPAPGATGHVPSDGQAGGQAAAAQAAAAQADAGQADAGQVDAGQAAAPGLRASLEAIMLVADEPVSEVVITQVLERPRAEVAGALRELAASYAAEQRGFDLREVAGGRRLYTREADAPVVERFARDGQGGPRAPTAP